MTSRGRCRKGIHSLRGQLTLANVALLALGIVVATAGSLMGMRTYLLDSVDTQLKATRDSIGDSRLTLEQVDSLSALAAVRARISPTPSDKEADADSWVQDGIFVAVDDQGRPAAIGPFAPTDTQRALAAAVDDPAALRGDEEPHDLRLDGTPTGSPPRPWPTAPRC